jgi:hypothetical protein
MRRMVGPHRNKGTLAERRATLKPALMNDAAREMAAYFGLQRLNPELPRTAWDTERGCLNEIPREPEPELQPQPRLYTRAT